MSERACLEKAMNLWADRADKYRYFAQCDMRCNRERWLAKSALCTELNLSAWNALRAMREVGHG